MLVQIQVQKCGILNLVLGVFSHLEAFEAIAAEQFVVGPQRPSI